MNSVKLAFIKLVEDSFDDRYKHYIKDHDFVNDVFSRFVIFKEIESNIDSNLDFWSIGGGIDSFWYSVRS